MRPLVHVAWLWALLATAAFAANFSPLNVTGYNYGGIVPRTATPPYSSVAQNLDLSNHALFEIGLPGATSGGLPQGGLLSFTVNANSYTFQLAPYGNGATLSNNLLRIVNPAGAYNLALATPGKFASVAVLGFSTEKDLPGGVEAVGDATLHFSDGSSSVYSGAINLSDWFIATPANPNIVVNAVGGLVNTTGVTAAAAFEANAGTGPRFFVSLVNLTPADTNKILTSVDIGNFPFGNTLQFVMGLAGSVLSSPTITKAFGAPSVALNGMTSLSFTITNPNGADQLTGVGVTDTLPSGLVVSTPNGLTGACGGGAITATAGSGSVSLSGATLAASASCTFAVNVTGASVGTKSNTTGAVGSNEGGAGGTASASVAVAAPPTITKTFGASTVALNGMTSLSFTITNPNSANALTGVGVNDTLPSGLVVRTPNGLTGSCGGGVITAAAGSGSISLSGATLAASASCTFAVNVTGASAGTKSNTTGAVSSNEGGPGGTASASVAVVAPPTITKTFGASTVTLNGTTSLSFTITNPNSGSSLTGVAVTDVLPSGLVVSTPNGLTGSCGGGTITATAGSGSIILSGATLAAGTSCTFAANVTGATQGTKSNTTGAVSSNEGGPGGTASASVAVAVSVPVLGTGMLALLALMLGTLGWLSIRRKASSR